MSTHVETMSPTTTTTTSGMDDYSVEQRQRRPPLDHASQLGAISDVTDEDDEER